MLIEVEKHKKDGVAKFDSFRTAINEFSEQCKSISVTDSATRSLAVNIISKAKTVEKAIEAEEEKLSRPYKDVYDNIKKVAKSVLVDLKEAVKQAKTEVLRFDEEEEKRKAAEIKRINDIKEKMRIWRDEVIFAIDSMKKPEDSKDIFAKYIKTFPGPDVWQEFNEEAQSMLAKVKEYGFNKRESLKNPAITEEVKELEAIITDEIQEVSENVGEAQIAIMQAEKPNGHRVDWKFEVIDESKVPINMMSPDKKKIDAWMKQARAGGMLEKEEVRFGIRFYPDKSLVVRG